jgi:hypothetical protein
MELCQHRADHATGLVIALLASDIRQRRIILGALHEDRVFPVRQYARRAVPVPPDHELVAKPLLVHGGYLEHGRHAARTHRQKPAGGGDNGFAVWR